MAAPKIADLHQDMMNKWWFTQNFQKLWCTRENLGDTGIRIFREIQMERILGEDSQNFTTNAIDSFQLLDISTYTHKDNYWIAVICHIVAKQKQDTRDQ
jgi:hypothetical protein